jgi:hypothetical protein
MYTTEMASCDMTYIASFMKTGTGVQALFRFCTGNLKGCNIDITEGRNL